MNTSKKWCRNGVGKEISNMAYQFTTANGKPATLLRTIKYNGRTIEKVRRNCVEFYTVDKKGSFWLLRDAIESAKER